ANQVSHSADNLIPLEVRSRNAKRRDRKGHRDVRINGGANRLRLYRGRNRIQTRLDYLQAGYPEVPAARGVQSGIVLDGNRDGASRGGDVCQLDKIGLIARAIRIRIE